jgi:hypothetical protein
VLRTFGAKPKTPIYRRLGGYAAIAPFKKYRAKLEGMDDVDPPIRGRKIENP